MPKAVAIPKNFEAEQSVLGAMLLDENAAATALARLIEEDFADKKNRLVFRAMISCANQKQAIEPTTVSAALENLHLYDQAGGSDYLFDLLKLQVTPRNADHYISIVKDTATLRNFFEAIRQIPEDYSESTNPGEFMEQASNKLKEIAQQRSVGDFESAAEVAKQVERRIDIVSARANDKRLTGVDTGFTKLNDLTHGWQPSDLVILAARTSVGKTAFAINLAFNGASLMDKPVAFFSLEMSNEQIMTRLLSSVSWVKGDDIQTGTIRKEDRIKLKNGLAQLSNTKLFFDDSPSAKLGDIVAKTRKLQAEHPDLCLVVIDYLTLIKTETKANSTAEQIGEITHSLKAMARSLKIPVICLAQLNRDVEGNESNRPKLSNLKGSGDIEQDADMVLLMYRSDYYYEIGQTQDPTKGMAKEGTMARTLQENVQSENAKKKDNSVSVTEVSVAKNRNGSIGNVYLIFDKDHSKFDNPSPDFENRLSAVQSGKASAISGVDD